MVIAWNRLKTRKLLGPHFRSPIQEILFFYLLCLATLYIFIAGFTSIITLNKEFKPGFFLSILMLMIIWITATQIQQPMASAA